MSTPDTDQLLLRRYAEGDSTAFAELYDRHQADLYLYLRVLLRDPAQAEDALQDVFLQVIRQLPRFLDADNPRAYLHATARNIARDRRRAEVRQEQKIQRAAGEGLLRPRDGAAGADTGRGVILSRALLGLEDEYREIITLHALEGMSFQQIEELTRIAADTLYRRYKRALIHLQRELQRQENES